MMNLQDKVRSSIEEKKNCMAIFMGLSKAFDLVDHSILLFKLHYYGVRGTPLKWFESYLTGRRQFTGSAPILPPILLMLPMVSLRYPSWVLYSFFYLY